MRASNTTQAPPRPDQGFTLVEMLVVIGVVGILVLMAAPSFNRSQSESRLDGVAGRLTSDIQMTRMLATKSGFYSFLLLDGGGNRWSIWLDKDRSNALDTTKDSLVRRDALETTVRFGFGFTAPSTIPVLGSSVPASGFGAVSSDLVEDCVSGVVYPANPAGAATWAKNSVDGLIVGCGGSTADIGNGVLYLTTTRSENKAYALVFNHVTVGSESFSVRRYKWTKGGAWTLQ